MNKKLMVFAMVGIIAMALVSGGLVSYLSNQAEVSVTVESPVLLEVSTDESTWSSNPATLSFGSIYGGEPITFWIRDTNLANVPIVGYSTKIVYNADGVTCDDFESVTVDGGYNLLNDCVEIDSKNVDFSAYTSASGGLDAGEVNTNEITMAFKQNAKGTYVFTMQKVPGTA